MLTVAFRTWRSAVTLIPGGRISALGPGEREIGRIIVLNLDRQPLRWRRVTRELGRFRTSGGLPLRTITHRLAAIDAKDARAVAATADVDVMYRVGDQLYVQPDHRLAESFAADEPVRMTRQEVAVARSHVEAWKTVAAGDANHVLVLEDDIWFARGAASAIDRGWRAAIARCQSDGGPKLLYLSYSDADGTAIREDVDETLFRPVRGLWFLSGYVLSRDGAEALLRAMPVVGPVDLWMNYRFAELGALAVNSPAIVQRHDGGSDNAYSILPYLARAGIIDGPSADPPPSRSGVGPVLAWTAVGETEPLPMALSMLGLRVRVFDRNDQPLRRDELRLALKTFDAVVDPPLDAAAFAEVTAHKNAAFLVGADVLAPTGIRIDQISLKRSAVLKDGEVWSWDVLCEVLGIPPPVDAFPTGAQQRARVFRDTRTLPAARGHSESNTGQDARDDSPWVLPASTEWQPMRNSRDSLHDLRERIAHAAMTEASPLFPTLVETFPGNLASFARECVSYGLDGTRLEIDVSGAGSRPYQSGAFASRQSFSYGRFESELKAAFGSGLITGFFLHRALPRQEIDIEISGADPFQMLVNVYFNPGDDGTAMGYGYRGAPLLIDLGFDASEGFHRYAIDWRCDRITWLVDGRVV
ncbi:MAG TPA: family 16 glycosylhydrolase, partial [Galbitalea sp.]|nr:family 16 glycosylhydrolase [Galbitalea sp.]